MYETFRIPIFYLQFASRERERLLVLLASTVVSQPQPMPAQSSPRKYSPLSSESHRYTDGLLPLTLYVEIPFIFHMALPVIEYSTAYCSLLPRTGSVPRTATCRVPMRRIANQGTMTHEDGVKCASCTAGAYVRWMGEVPTPPTEG